MAELATALGHTAQAALAGGDPDAGLETATYEAALSSLPLPTPAEIEDAAHAVFAGGSAIDADDLHARRSSSESRSALAIWPTCTTPARTTTSDRSGDA